MLMKCLYVLFIIIFSNCDLAILTFLKLNQNGGLAFHSQYERYTKNIRIPQALKETIIHGFHQKMSKL